MGRRGLRIADLLDKQLLKKHIENACQEKNTIANIGCLNPNRSPRRRYSRNTPRSPTKLRRSWPTWTRLLNLSIREGKSVMFEGAQGTMLDIDHGTYPFVTSSSATAGGAVTGTGVGPLAIGTVIGVTKAYCTRVGEGPFPCELSGPLAEEIRKRGNEYGAVTGRPRRCGWIDLPLLRYSNFVNSTEWLVVTKLDVLDELAGDPGVRRIQNRRQDDR